MDRMLVVSLDSSLLRFASEFCTRGRRRPFACSDRIVSALAFRDDKLGRLAETPEALNITFWGGLSNIEWYSLGYFVLFTGLGFWEETHKSVR